MRFNKAILLGALAIASFSLPAGAEQFSDEKIRLSQERINQLRLQYERPTPNESLRMISPTIKEQAAEFEDAWEKQYGKVNWVKKLQEVGIDVKQVQAADDKPCIPKNSKVRRKPGDIACEESQVSKVDTQALTQMIEGINKANRNDAIFARCLQRTDTHEEFDACVESNGQIIAQRGAQNSKKALAAPSGGIGPSQSLDALGNVTGAD